MQDSTWISLAAILGITLLGWSWIHAGHNNISLGVLCGAIGTIAGAVAIPSPIWNNKKKEIEKSIVS